MGHKYVASVVRMHAPNMFDTAGQTNKTSPIKHENKKKKMF